MLGIDMGDYGILTRNRMAPHWTWHGAAPDNAFIRLAIDTILESNRSPFPLTPEEAAVRAQLCGLVAGRLTGDLPLDYPMDHPRRAL